MMIHREKIFVGPYSIVLGESSFRPNSWLWQVFGQDLELLDMDWGLTSHDAALTAAKDYLKTVLSSLLRELEYA